MEMHSLSEFFHKGLANNFAMIEFDNGAENPAKLLISLSDGAFLYHKGDKDGHKLGPFKKGAMIVMKGIDHMYFDKEDIIQ